MQLIARPLRQNLTDYLRSVSPCALTISIEYAALCGVYLESDFCPAIWFHMVISHAVVSGVGLCLCGRLGVKATHRTSNQWTIGNVQNHGGLLAAVAAAGGEKGVRWRTDALYVCHPQCGGATLFGREGWGQKREHGLARCGFGGGGFGGPSLSKSKHNIQASRLSFECANRDALNLELSRRWRVLRPLRNSALAHAQCVG